jgi:predicted MFS family arabinose efflux permease
MGFTKRHLLVYGSALLDPLIVLAYNPLVPVLKTEFRVSVDLIALSLTFHMLPFALLNLVSGTVSDRYHRPTILVYGLGLSTVGSVLSAVAPNLSVFYLSRMVHGVGSAFIMPITMALVADLTAPSRMGQVMGIYGMFIGSATTLGPLMGGYLASTEWRIVPMVLAVYSGVVALLVRWGFMTTEAPKPLLRSESQVTQQLRQSLQNRGVLAASLAGFLLFFTFQGIQPLLADHLSLPPLVTTQAEIGVFLAVVGVVGILFSALSGRIVGSWGSRRTMMGGFVAILLPQSLLLVANSYWSYLAAFTLLGSVQRILLTAAQTLTLESAGTSRGSASSVFNFTRYLGFALAPTAMSAVYLAYGLRVLFLLNLGILVLGSLWVRSLTRAPET